MTMMSSMEISTPGSLQLLIKAQQVGVVRLFDKQGVNAQRITVATGVGQHPHRVEVARRDRRQDAMRYTFGSSLCPNDGGLRPKLCSIEVTMGVDEEHGLNQP